MSTSYVESHNVTYIRHTRQGYYSSPSIRESGQDGLYRGIRHSSNVSFSFSTERGVPSKLTQLLFYKSTLLSHVDIVVSFTFKIK